MNDMDLPPCLDRHAESQGLSELLHEALRQAKANGGIAPPRMTPSLTEQMQRRIARKQRKREKETRRAERDERKRLRLQKQQRRDQRRAFRAKMATAQATMEI